MKSSLSFSLSFILLTIFSCQENNKTSLAQNRILVSSVSNLSTQEPFHEVWIQKKDTLWKHDLWKNEKKFSTSQIKAFNQENLIAFQNEDSLWAAPKFTLHKNLHTFVNKQNLQSFVETEAGQAIQEKDFKKLVKNRVFKTSIHHLKAPNSAFQIHEKIRFSANKISFFWEYYYAEELMHSETETLALSYFEVENQLFIIPSTQENPYPIYQVVEANPGEIKLAYFTDFERKIKSYKLSENVNRDQYNTYSLCRDSFQSLYYVGEDVRYDKGMDHLLAYLQQDAPKTEGNGFINIHFTINCEGKVGRLGLELLDKNYQPTLFHPKLVEHVVDKVKQINNWSNLEKIEYMGAKDAKAFFLIQIANRKIVEVCP